MGQALTKTNVIRLLEASGIEHLVHSYDPGPDFDAGAAALKVGVEPERVFKTLVASGGGTTYFVFCLPSVLELDLRKAAAAAGSPKTALIRQDELLDLTGYVRGGCSPLAMKKAFPTFVDESAQLFETLCVSAGQRGLFVELKLADLLELGARLLPRMELADLS